MPTPLLLIIKGEGSTLRCCEPEEIPGCHTYYRTASVFGQFSVAIAY